MKKVLTTILATILVNVLLAQRSTGPRSFEAIGLPDGNDITESLMIAIPLLVVGFLLAYGFIWSKDDEQVSETSENIGCFGIILMGVGGFCLFPLLTWLEFIFVSIYSIGTALLVIAVIGYAIYSLFKKE